MIRKLLVLSLLGWCSNVDAQQVLLPAKVDQQWTFLQVDDKSAQIDETKLYDLLGDVNLPWLGQPRSQSGYYPVEREGKLGVGNFSIRTGIGAGLA